PDAVWASGDPRVVHRGAIVFEMLDSAQRVKALSTNSSAALGAQLPPVPPAVQTAATRWVGVVNAANPDAILWSDTDATGNLYVAFGAWWSILTPDQQMVALDKLGMGWRAYLIDVFGQWDTREAFAPGIVVLGLVGDEPVLVGSNLNGKVALFVTPGSTASNP